MQYNQEQPPFGPYLGKGEVESSILSRSTSNPMKKHISSMLREAAKRAEPSANESRGVARNWQSLWGYGGGFYGGERTNLYRYFDEDGALLYVGITNQLRQRDTAHWKSKRWRREAALISVEWFPTRRLAEFCEGRAIWAEDPAHNVLRRWPIEPPVAPIDRHLVDPETGIIPGLDLMWFESGGYLQDCPTTIPANPGPTPTPRISGLQPIRDQKEPRP